jgi:hypothetical protein
MYEDGAAWSPWDTSVTTMTWLQAGRPGFVRFQVFTAMWIRWRSFVLWRRVVFCLNTIYLTHFSPENRGSTFLRTVSIKPTDNTVQQYRTPPSMTWVRSPTEAEICVLAATAPISTLGPIPGSKGTGTWSCPFAPSMLRLRIRGAIPPLHQTPSRRGA